MREPEVTFVVCTRNRSHQLGAMLQSLANLSTTRAWEAIVADNASTDDTSSVIHEFAARDHRIRYMKVDRIGLGAAREAAWREARAPLISFTDDDCYLAPDYVDRIVEAFAQFPQTGAIGGRILLHDPANARITIDDRTEASLYPAHQVIRAGAVQGANLSFRKVALERSGGFDPCLGAGTRFPSEDIDAAAALIWAGFDVRYDPRPTVSHHHGRTNADVPGLLANYDACRGAYWAKYMLRPDTRVAHLKHYLKQSARFRTLPKLFRLIRELRSAAAYAAARRQYGSIVLATPLAIAMVAYVGLRVLAATFRKRLQKANMAQ